MGVIYLIIGVLFAARERTLFAEEIDYRFAGEKFLDFAQHTVHFFRVVLTWPLYFAEEIIISISNRFYAEEG